MIVFWRRLGAKIELMDPQTHDRILAVVSHMPHILAYTLVNTLMHTRVDSVDMRAYCGGGFKDFTRIAASRPEIWRDICLVNRQAIAKSLVAYMKRLERLKSWIESGKGMLLDKEFLRASEFRRAMR